MNIEKASELVGYYRQKAKAIGIIIWVVSLILGGIGAVFWSGGAILLAILLAFLIGSIYSYLQTQKLINLTGYDVSQLGDLFKGSAAARLDPIAKDPGAYKAFIDSLPD